MLASCTFLHSCEATHAHNTKDSNENARTCKCLRMARKSHTKYHLWQGETTQPRGAVNRAPCRSCLCGRLPQREALRCRDAIFSNSGYSGSSRLAGCSSSALVNCKLGQSMNTHGQAALQCEHMRAAPATSRNVAEHCSLPHGSEQNRTSRISAKHDPGLWQSRS